MPRFFVAMRERSPADPQEGAAMLQLRLDAIRYRSDLLASGSLVYAFFAKNGLAICMYKSDSHERLDYLLKRDPQFGYCDTQVIPVINTLALVDEAEDYLNERILTDSERANLVQHEKPIDDAMSYWLAWKEVKPFSPLLPLAVQDDIHRRTLTSQRAHTEEFEFSDDNPVGRPIGILVAEGPLDRLQAHVERCDVFPDTVVEYTQLLTCSQMREFVCLTLEGMRRVPKL